MGFGNVGKVWTPMTFREYVKTIKPDDRWKGVTLHHTASPSLAQRPDGLKMQHIVNIRDFYKNEKGWSSGPHLFTDDDEIYGMCPLNEKGIHAVSFNSSYLGIEALGDYDVENPKAGRGLEVWQTTAQATAILLEWLKLPVTEETIKFHRNDPKTTKTCPGNKVKKDWIMDLILTYLNAGPDGPDIERWDVILKSRGNKSWTLVENQANKVCVPVFAFLSEYEVPSADIIAKLKCKNKRYFYGETELEGGYPDAQGSTWAPIREVAALVNQPVVASGRVITVG